MIARAMGLSDWNNVADLDIAQRQLAIVKEWESQIRAAALEEAAKVCERLAMQIETETIVCDWDGPEALDEAAKDIRKQATHRTATGENP